MKAKHVFLTLGLALTMGLGVAASLVGNKPIQKADAATLDNGATVYLDFGGNGHGWADDSANVYAWTWYNDKANSKWETVSYDATSGFHKFTLTSTGATGFTLLREDSGDPARSGTTWGEDDGWNKLDVYFQEGKNLINATTAGSVGEWESFDGNNVYGLVGNFNNWGADRSDILLTGEGTTRTVTKYLSQYALAKIRVNYRWNLDYGYFALVVASQDKFTNSEGNMRTKVAGDYTFNFNTSSHEITVGLESDVPAEDGYYIVGTESNWKYEGATKMSTDPAVIGENIAVYKGYVAHENEEIKIRSYLEGVDTWYGNDIGENCQLTSTEGNYDIYLNSSSHVYAYHNEPAPVYTVQLAGVSKDLSLNEGTEYQTEVMNLTAGQSVAVYRNGVLDNTFGPKLIGNNNIDGSGNVLVNATSARIYVDISAKTVFVGGMPHGGYGIIKNGTTYIAMTHGSPYEGFDQYYSDLVSFAQDDVIRFVNNTFVEGEQIPEVFDIGTINAGGLGDKFQISGGHIVCKTATSAQVYLKLKFGLDEIYFGTAEQKYVDATNFASGFNTAIGTICTAIEGEQDKKNDMESEWASQATAFKALDETAQDVVKEGSSSTIQEIKDFYAKYERVYRKHKLGTDDWNLEDFLEAGITSNNVRPLVEVNNSALIITLVSITVVCVGAVAVYMTIKRRKHDK